MRQFGEAKAIRSQQEIIVGPLIATWVFGYFISPAAPFKIPGSPFLLGAALVLVALALAYQALKLQGSGAAEAVL